jgi:carboxypeptidase PM20D1
MNVRPRLARFLRKRFGKILLAGIAVLALVTLILVVRTVSLTSYQIDVGAAGASPEPVVDEKAVATRLAAALRFRSISTREAGGFDLEPFEQLVTWLMASFPSVYERLQVAHRAGPSLLLRWHGTDSSLPGGLFMAHLDVVPIEPGTEADWTYPPFAGKVADGFVWGRGAIDIKSGVVGLHEAIASLLRHGVRPVRDLWFAFGHDEEVGGTAGNKVLAEWMLKQKHELAFVVDEGGMVIDGALPELGQRPLAIVNIAEKGYATVELSAHGAGGHSSMPPRSTTVGHVARAIARLEADPFPATLDGVLTRQFDHLAPELPFPNRLVFANRWLFSSLILGQLAKKHATNAIIRTSTAATMIEGGVQENVIPQSATATINFRTLPGVTGDDVLARVKRVIDDHELEARLTEAWLPPPPARVDTPWYRAIARATREEYRDAVVVPSLAVGATDSRHYGPLTSNIYRFLGFRLHLDDVAGMHGTDERLSVTGYARGIKILFRMLRSMGGAR